MGTSYGILGMGRKKVGLLLTDFFQKHLFGNMQVNRSGDSGSQATLGGNVWPPKCNAFQMDDGAFILQIQNKKKQEVHAGETSALAAHVLHIYLRLL